MASVDVIVPCYRYAHYLRRCVESVLTQQGVDVRVLILDDCSPDDTPQVAQQLCADSRVEYRRHAVNQGHIATYNEGIDWATADYLLLLSADDMIVPGALERAARLLDAHPNVVLAYGRAPILHRDDPLPAFTSELHDDRHQVVDGWAFVHHCCTSLINPVPTPCAVVRTSTQKLVGGYDGALPHTGDMEMWMRLALYGDIGILHAPQGIYFLHGENMSLDYQRVGLLDLPEREQALAKLFDLARDVAPRFLDLQPLARHAIAAQAVERAYHAWEYGEVEVCRQCLAFAVAHLPEITKTRAWRRQQWKLALGRRPVELWRALKQLVRSSGRAAAQRSAASAPADRTTSWWGWWPETSVPTAACL